MEKVELNHETKNITTEQNVGGENITRTLPRVQADVRQSGDLNASREES